MVAMFRETKERFSDPDFVLHHYREILAEYEWYRQRKLGEPGSPLNFYQSWRDFLVAVGEKEGIESVQLEKRFYSVEEFRSIVGKKLLFDVAFTNKSHGETSHAIQILFIYRHFKDLKVPDALIDDYFRLLSTADDDWNRLLMLLEKLRFAGNG